MGNKYFSSQQHQNDIAFSFSPVQMNQMVVLLDNNQATFFNRYGLTGCKGWISAQLIELYLYADITVSIPEVKPPELIRNDDYNNTVKTNDYLWKTSRMELELYKRSRFGSWIIFGVVPIKHNAGFRYRRSRLIDMFTDNVQSELGRGGAVGVRLMNVGFGSLTPPDKVSIVGSWIQEPVIIQEQLPYVTNTVNSYGATSSTSPSPSPSPTPTTEVVNEFNIDVPGLTTVLQARAKRTSLTITVLTPGASGGAIGAWENNNFSTAVSPNPIAWTPSETNKIITGLTSWKGEVRANHYGFGDPGDKATLKITEKYTP